MELPFLHLAQEIREIGHGDSIGGDADDEAVGSEHVETNGHGTNLRQNRSFGDRREMRPGDA